MRLHSLSARHVLLAVIAAYFAVSAPGCGRWPATTATPTGSAGPVIISPSRAPSRAPAKIGADCGMLPATGTGSIRSMHTQHALTAASSNPQLSIFTAAVHAAGLAKTLNTRRSYTLMIPANSAFAALSQTQTIHLHNLSALRKIVRYHAVKTRISPQQFASRTMPTTLQGNPLRLSKTGSIYTVNSATVLCGNIRTSNATVYIVSKVLLPPR